MNPNLSGNQWRPLQPQSSDYGSGNGGNLFNQHPQPRPTRQITKNPQNMSIGFQNFPPNGFGANSFGSNSGNSNMNNGPLSPPLSNSASTGRLTSLMSPNGGGGHGNIGNFDFLGASSNRPADQTRLSPSFNSNSGPQQNRGGPNLINMPNPLSPREFERHSMNNGFDSVRQPSIGQSPNTGLSNGFRNAPSTNFERSMSTNMGMSGNGLNQTGSFFDQFKNSTSSSTSNTSSEINSLLRHMSVPNGITDNGQAGLGRTGGLNNVPGMMSQSPFMRQNNAMSSMKSPTSNNGFSVGFPNSNNRSEQLFTSIGGGPAFNNRHENEGLTMRNTSPPLSNSTYNGGGSMDDMKIGMWNDGTPSSPGQVNTLIFNEIHIRKRHELNCPLVIKYFTGHI